MAPTEDTPLLSGSSKPSSGVSTIATTDNSQKLSRMSFRRIIPTSKNATNTTSTDTPRAKRQSARGADFMNSYDDDDDDRQQEMLLALSGESRRAAVEPVDGLSPLSITGSITTTDGYTTHPRPVSTVKSLPAFAPFRRTARHRSFYLWWINEFRHWWKSSRLLVRLAGLFTLALTGLFLQRMLSVTPYYALPHLNKKWSHKQKKHVLKLFYKQMRKNTRQAVKVVKKLGQGGPMRFFLQYVHPFTRSLRLLVGIWRWTEAAQCRRGEVGTEEAFVRGQWVGIGNAICFVLLVLFGPSWFMLSFFFVTHLVCNFLVLCLSGFTFIFIVTHFLSTISHHQSGIHGKSSFTHVVKITR